MSGEVVSLRAGRGDADYNAQILKPLLWYLEDRISKEAAAECLRACELEREAITARRPGWMSFDQFDRFLQAMSRFVPDDGDFERASIHRLPEVYGPLRFVLWATTPQRVLEMAARHMHLMSSVSRWEIIESTQTSIHARYHSSRPETRRMCLSRLAQARALPTLWGLPEAQMEVAALLADGAQFDEIHLRLYARSTWMPTVLGGLAGLGLALLASLSEPLPWLFVSFTTAGAAIGSGWENRRTYRKNLGFGEDVTGALREVARNETEARTELQSMHQRQREWARLMEEQVRDRTATLQQVVEDIRGLQEDREVTLRGVTHDLRNPLSVIQCGLDAMEEGVAERDDLNDMRQAVERMDGMLGALIRSASSELSLLEVKPERVDVPPMVERLRRRLRALTHGRPVRVSVFSTREAPEQVSCDPLLMDRVLDNVLSNAAKYTESGSIIVEVGGTPGFLTVKVSDSGKGIADEDIEKIFRAEATPAHLRGPRSFGVGLSVVVQLLDQIGGRLEVMSRLGRGTTFWAHFPEALRLRVAEPNQRAFDRVVTIRNPN
ncbi:MAG: HAMP domain-containing sensor histidine kinase [Myxococcota bacterium]